MKSRFTLLLLVASFTCPAQLAYPYKVFSENEQYFVQSTPFSDQAGTWLGKTVVFSIRDTLRPLATIPRYFSPDNLFLSNDGIGLFYLQNWIYPSSGANPEILTYYSAEKLLRIYGLHDFELSDSSAYSVLYNSDSDSELADSTLRYLEVNRQNNSMIAGDTLFLFTANELVFKFSMLSGLSLEKETFESFLNSRKPKNTRKIINYQIQIPTQFGLPKLASGNEVWDDLGAALEVVFLEGEESDYKRRYGHHTFKIDCSIDSSGACRSLGIDMDDQYYKTKISEFIQKATFDKNEIPTGIEKWHFHYITGFRKKSKAIARRERKQEIRRDKIDYRNRIAQDSIDHIYIPVDLADSFKQLDGILPAQTRTAFMDTNEDEVGGLYHMGLGLWIRNNWGLWSGSRLSHYFKTLGISHPDDMSSIILKSYHRHLGGRAIKLNDQIKEHKEWWRKAKVKLIKIKKWKPAK